LPATKSNSTNEAIRILLLIVICATLLVSLLVFFANSSASRTRVVRDNSAVTPVGKNVRDDLQPNSQLNESLPKSEPLAPAIIADPISPVGTPSPPRAPVAATFGVDYYLKDHYSAEIPDGIVGFEPGKMLKKICSGKYMADGILLTLSDSQVTTDPADISREPSTGPSFTPTQNFSNSISGEKSRFETHGSGPVFVHEYYRSDGTRVSAHYRSR
jgi:hypothetical protein